MALVLKKPKQTDFEVPEHLRTSWTSHDAERFAEILDSLKEALRSESKSADYCTLGFNEVLKRIKRDSLRILCVIACVDNGGNVARISNLCRECYLTGVPVILGRGPRQLGSLFMKNRVCCAALSKSVAANPLLEDFLVNFSSLCSVIKIPLEDASEVIDRFGSAPTEAKREPAHRKPVAIKDTSPPQKKRKTAHVNPTRFFTSFD